MVNNVGVCRSLLTFLLSPRLVHICGTIKMGQECGLITSTAEHARRPLNCISELSKQVIYGSWPDCLWLPRVWLHNTACVYALMSSQWQIDGVHCKGPCGQRLHLVSLLGYRLLNRVDLALSL